MTTGEKDNLELGLETDHALTDGCRGHCVIPELGALEACGARRKVVDAAARARPIPRANDGRHGTIGQTRTWTTRAALAARVLAAIDFVLAHAAPPITVPAHVHPHTPLEQETDSLCTKTLT